MRATRRFRPAIAMLCAVAGVTLAQNAAGPDPLNARIVANVDGGQPGFVMLGAGGSPLKATDDIDNPGLYVRLDEFTISTLTKGLTDGCALGLQVSGITVQDQAVDSAAVFVPLLPDGGNPAEDPTLVDIFVQNTTQAVAKNLRCAHSGFDSGVVATCAKGTRITPDSAAVFPVRYPDRISCICCSAGSSTTGCSAATSLRVCVQPAIP